METPTPQVIVISLSPDELKAMIDEAVRNAMHSRNGVDGDKLIDINEAAELLSMTKNTLYHKAKKLPFTRKVGGSLRFSRKGVLKYIDSKKLGSV